MARRYMPNRDSMSCELHPGKHCTFPTVVSVAKLHWVKNNTTLTPRPTCLEGDPSTKASGSIVIVNSFYLGRVYDMIRKESLQYRSKSCVGVVSPVLA